MPHFPRHLYYCLATVKNFPGKFFLTSFRCYSNIPRSGSPFSHEVIYTQSKRVLFVYNLEGDVINLILNNYMMKYLSENTKSIRFWHTIRSPDLGMSCSLHSCIRLNNKPKIDMYKCIILTLFSIDHFYYRVKHIVSFNSKCILIIKKNLLLFYCGIPENFQLLITFSVIFKLIKKNLNVTKICRY